MKSHADKFRRVGIVANPEKPKGVAIVRQAIRLVRSLGGEVALDPTTAMLAGLRRAAPAEIGQLARFCDLLLVLGGDGTILRVARESAGTRTPILGINMGRLGFLTTSAATDLAATLKRVWAGEYRIESRPLIEALGRTGGRPIREVALNDFVISHGTVPRLIELKVSIDREVLTCYRGDGLIVSSPTGSTAYSLAAGGAVVSPQANVFALTPICPHTLSNRSVIVSLDSTVEVELLSERVQTFLAADGQSQAELCTGDCLRFRRSRHRACLVRFPESSFFETLRRKLSWSGSTG